MPERPDITVYVESLEPRIEGAALNTIRLNNPFLLDRARYAGNAISGNNADRVPGNG